MSGLALLEIGFVKKPTDFKGKYAGIKQYAPEIEMLVLGHSHSNEGFDSRITGCRSYNLGMGFQNVYYDRAVLEQFIERMDSLKYVVISASYIHFFITLPDIDQMGGEDLFNTVKFHKYWNIGEVNGETIPRLSPKFNLEILSNPPTAYFAMFRYYLRKEAWSRKQNPEQEEYLKYGYRPKDVCPGEAFLDEDGLRRSLDHKPHYKSEPVFEYTPNYFIYDSIAKICAEKGVKFYMVMFPCWHTYTDNLEPFQLESTRKMLSDLSQSNDNCFVLDHMTDERFVAGDFQDAIHMNKYGAEKITRILEEEITE